MTPFLDEVENKQIEIGFTGDEPYLNPHIIRLSEMVLERGSRCFQTTIKGLDWLTENGFDVNVAGRSAFSETVSLARAGYDNLIKARGSRIDASNPSHLILFPEMDEQVDVPEITTACWRILDIHPDTMMRETSRMVVHRKGENDPAVLGGASCSA